QFEIASSQFLGLDAEKSIAEKGLQYKVLANRFTTEIGCLLIWAYRRNRKNEKALELGQRLLKTNPDDPRIIQGIALANTASLYETIREMKRTKSDAEKETVLEKIKQTISYLWSARAIYLSWYYGKYKEDKISQIVMKNYIAVC